MAEKKAAPKTTAPPPKHKAADKPKAAPTPPSLQDDLRAVRTRILAEREQYASPVSGRLTRVANDIEDVVSAAWVDTQLKREVTVMAKAALIDMHGPRNTNTRTKYLPVIKHAVPLCPDEDRNCQKEGGSDWWKTCSHDPYFSWQDVPVITPAVYEDIVNADGSPSTRKQLVEPEKVVMVKDRAPNLRESPVSTRHLAQGTLQSKWDRRGYKDVNHPDIGLKPFCQMRGCWSQDTKQYGRSIACSDDHARLLVADMDESPLEVLNGRKRARQLAEMNI